jgi:hypothetical protein
MMQKMLSFLLNPACRAALLNSGTGVQECDARKAGLCTNADLIKNKNTLHLLF